jgi:choline kinase
MRGIILAAGKGSRLNGTIGDKPKCLLRVGGKSLLERQIEALKSVGITDIVVVVGCQADTVRRTCGVRITYVENSRFAQTNSLYSLWLARPLLYDGFVVMNCDVLFHPQLLSDLVTSRHEDALLIAYQDDDAAPPDLDLHLGSLLDQRVAGGGLRDWAPKAFGDFARIRPLHTVGTRGYPWTEIDFPEDYERAVRDILPAIEGEDVILAGDGRRTSNTTVIEQSDATIVVRRVRLRPDAGAMPLSPASGE